MIDTDRKNGTAWKKDSQSPTPSPAPAPLSRANPGQRKGTADKSYTCNSKLQILIGGVSMLAEVVHVQFPSLRTVRAEDGKSKGACRECFLSLFFHTRERKTECLALREGGDRGKGGVCKVNYLSTITASNSLHPSPVFSSSSYPRHTFGPAFPPDPPNTLSFQSGPSLHPLQT